MHYPHRARRAARLFGLLIVIATTLWFSAAVPNPARVRAFNRSADRGSGAQAGDIAAARQASDQFQTYLPLVVAPWTSPFGVQSEVSLTSGTLLTRTLDLRAGWARVGPVSWRALQPNEGDPIRWELLADFERELRALQAVGITPEVVVIYSPRWATINTPFPTSCGAIRSDKFAAFAAFMRALVERYKTPEFGLHNWELGNEVDVDPRLVQPDNGFGCWGDIGDPFYGGRHYGEMLKIVTPVIRAADPQAKIWLGGLLLYEPHTTAPSLGRPELFLQGVLEAGGAAYFDVLPYHAYPPYLNQITDPDNATGGPWDAWGGFAAGKARFLRKLMQGYGVDKPLFLNETALMCPDHPPYDQWCTPPNDDFFQMQANYLVRAMTRGFAEHVEGMIWFTINGPGWRYTGLLDGNANPTPAYMAYRQLSAQLERTEYLGPADYDPELEGYTFTKGSQWVQVLWAKHDQTLAVTIPQFKFVGAYTRDGNMITPISAGTDLKLLVQFQPIYLIREP
jgi:hypothetical protein